MSSRSRSKSRSRAKSKSSKKTDIISSKPKPRKVKSVRIQDTKPLKKKKSQRKKSKTPSADDQTHQFKQRYHEKTDSLKKWNAVSTKKKKSKKLKKSQSMKNIFDDTNTTETSEQSEKHKTTRSRSFDLGNTLTPMMTNEGQSSPAVRTTKMLNEQMYALLNSDLSEEKVSEEQKEKEAVENENEPESGGLSVYNAISWGVSSGQSLCSLALMFGYYHAWNGGFEAWRKYQMQRRVCLLSTVGFGVVSVVMKMKNYENALLVVPKIVQNMIVPLFLVYLEYVKGINAAKYGFVSLYGAYALDMIMDKFETEVLVKYGGFKKTKRLRQSSTEIAQEASLL